MSYSTCINCQQIVPNYEKYCHVCLCRYPQLKQVDDFWIKYARRQLAFHVRDAKKLREKIQAKAVGAVRRRDELSGETSPIRLYRAKVDQLMRKYQLTPEMFEELKRQQNGCCAICEQPTEKLVIDHDHSTMRRRALLCAHCNSGLGFFRDKPDVMRAAASYVESHNDNQK